MRIPYIMRYQRPFPDVIPLLKAGCSRVTHPSATDPRSKLLFTVRLACVKRAASVRPEPGSNSLVSLYFISPFQVSLKSSCSVTFITDSFFKNFSSSLEFPQTRNFKGFFQSSLFNFQGSVVPQPQLRNFFIISLRFAFVKYFFQNSFQMLISAFLTAVPDSFIILTYSSCFVKRFLSFFWFLLIVLVIFNIMSIINSNIHNRCIQLLLFSCCNIFC